MWWVIMVVAAVVLVATYLTWLAARIDRLHARAVAAYATLDAHLVRRAVAAAALESPQLTAVARAALDAPPEEREAAENDLTRYLRAARGTAGLVQVSRRVALARQVHNDVVRDALAVRRRPLVRLFRLARKHPRPMYFDVDDPSLS